MSFLFPVSCIIHTTACFTKSIIKSQLSLYVQSLKQETKILFEGKVSIQTVVGGIADTVNTKVFITISSSLSLIRFVISESTIAIYRHKRIGRNAIESTPYQIFILPLRGFLYCMRTRQIQMQFGSLGKIEVKVTAYVYTIIAETRIVTFHVGYFLIYIPLMCKVSRSKILHKLRTTTNVHVGIIGCSDIFQQIIYPIYIRITFCLSQISRMTILVQTILSQIITP